MKKIWNLPRVELASFDEIHEKSSTLLLTSAPAWNAVGNNLRGLNIAATIEVTEATTENWDTLQSAIANRKSEIVYAVGGGLVADAAKYFASKLDLPLVILPTALSVDAFITAASGIRKDGCVYYIETKAPETLMVARTLLARTPGPKAGLVVLVAFLAASPPFFEQIFCGHVNIVILGLLLAAMVAEDRGQEVRAGLLVAFAGGLKLGPILLAADFLLRRRWRALFGVAAGAAALALLPIATYGWPGRFGFTMSGSGRCGPTRTC